MARPQAQAHLTVDQIEELASFGCTDLEIATLARISEATLKRSFEPQLKSGRAQLRSDLRSVQIKKAKGVQVLKEDKDGKQFVYTTPPDSTMLIWLGKQYLDQRDKAEVKDTTDDLDWDSVPDDLNDQFADGLITLEELKRKLRKRSKS